MAYALITIDTLSKRYHLKPDATGKGEEMARKLNRSDQERQVLDTYVKLRRAVNTLRGRESEHLRSAGLTESQFGVLEALDHLGPMCQKDLARKILRSAGNVTTVITNLVDRGLVTRDRSSRDRRVFVVQLTPNGQRLIRSVFPDHVACLVDAFTVLDAEEQKLLGALCKKLGIRGSGDRGERPR